MKRLLFFTLLVSSFMYGAVADEQVPKKRRIEDGKTITVKTSDGQLVEVPKGYFPTLDDCVSDLGADNLGEEGIPLEHITATDLDGAVALVEKKPGIITEGVLAALYYLGYPRALPAVYSAWLQKDENKKEPIHRGTEKQLLQHMGLDRKKCAGDVRGIVWELNAKELAEVEADERKTCIRKRIDATDEREVDFSCKKINSLCCLHQFINPAIITKLYLSFNKLTEIALGTFDKLQALQELSLGYNQLTKIEPETFDKLTALQELYLGGNQLTKIEPGTFDKLQALQILNLNFNKLTEIAPETFDKLQALQKLFLWNNPWIEIAPETFDQLPALQKLSLGYNQLQPENIEDICRALPNVEVHI